MGITGYVLDDMNNDGLKNKESNGEMVILES